MAESFLARAKRSLAILLALLLALAMSAQIAAAREIVLHRANGAEPDTLDPQKSSGTWEANITGDMFLGLMTEDSRGRPTYGSAISYAVSPDGLLYTFKLRPGLTWSDGVPVTARDFVFALQRLLDPKTAAPEAALLYPIKNARAVNGGHLPPSAIGARAIDAQTLAIALGHPTPYFISLLTLPATFPLPEHTLAKFGAQWSEPQHIEVNGAYKLAAWVPGAYVKLVKNPRFYDAKDVQIDEVDYLPISNNADVLRRFRAGEIDVANDFPMRDYARLKSGGYSNVLPSEVRVYPYAATGYILFNTRSPPFDNPLIRRALSLAIDRSVIAGKILGTGQAPAYALVPPGISDYSNGPQLDFKSWTMPKRLAEARTILEKAGYGPGHPLRFQFRYRDNPDNGRIAIAYQAMWRTIGAEAELLDAETAAHFNALRTRDFEVADAAWVADYDDAQNFLFLLQSTSGQMNYGGYSNPAYDALLAKAAQAGDAQAREKLLQAAEAIELRDEPIAPVFFSASRALVRRSVEGWDDNVLNWHRTRYLRIAG